jgi:hypothetical protein
MATSSARGSWRPQPGDVALLALYQALRAAVTDAVQSVPDPTQTGPAGRSPSKPPRTSSPPAQNINDPGEDLTATSAAPSSQVCTALAVPPLGLQDQIPAQRWNKHSDGKPRTICRVTGITVHVHASYH